MHKAHKVIPAQGAAVKLWTADTVDSLQGFLWQKCTSSVSNILEVWQLIKQPFSKLCEDVSPQHITIVHKQHILTKNLSPYLIVWTQQHSKSQLDKETGEASAGHSSLSLLRSKLKDLLVYASLTHTIAKDTEIVCLAAAFNGLYTVSVCVCFRVCETQACVYPQWNGDRVTCLLHWRRLR